MQRYVCKFMSERGQIVTDVFESDSVASLKSAFIQRGCKLISYKEKKEFVLNKSIGSAKLKNKNVVLFCRQMATLLRAGVPLIKCFDILMSQNKDPLLQSTLKTLSLDIQSGAMLSASMASMGNRFPQMLIKMIEIGEATGKIDDILERMANKYEKDSTMKKKLKNAMTYPVFLIVAALAACVFMLTTVVPAFVKQFTASGNELPGITKVMVNISDSLTAKWYIYLISLVLIVLIIMRVYAIPVVKKKIAYFLFAKSPIKGPISKLVCAQISRTLSILISSGIPIVHAIEYVAKNIDNVYVKDCLEKIAIGMQEGKGLSEQLEAFNSFPALFVSMVSIGEASGKLEEMLAKTAEYYDGETEAAIEQLMALLQPAMIVIVGGLIGVIVVAMYAPMFGMYDTMM